LWATAIGDGGGNPDHKGKQVNPAVSGPVAAGLHPGGQLQGHGPAHREKGQIQPAQEGNKFGQELAEDQDLKDGNDSEDGRQITTGTQQGHAQSLEQFDGWSGAHGSPWRPTDGRYRQAVRPRLATLTSAGCLRRTGHRPSLEAVDAACKRNAGQMQIKKMTPRPETGILSAEADDHSASLFE
jgi:hypothetical protein